MEMAYNYFLRDPIDENNKREWGDLWDVCVQEYVKYQMRCGFPVSASEHEIINYYLQVALRRLPA